MIDYKTYNPDILETIANLSNDEVFTPPKLANDILDLLPKEIWGNSKITFLDPAVKTGIFLREIARRLIEGLADEIPDLQERVNHILTKQVFGIGITELTTLMARRTLYCSMYANGPMSICTEFDNPGGNIIFPSTEHTWDKNGRCEYCGTSKGTYSIDDGVNRENYAYPFIHDNFKKEFGNMKFDVIIGNPPYQLSMGNTGGNSSKSAAIYHLFIDKALELQPQYITMIIPSRWMSGSADGIPNEWVRKMVNNDQLKIIHDFDNADDLFNGVGIAGGINYFLWDKIHKGDCNFTHHKEDVSESFLIKLNAISPDIVIRNPKSNAVIKKVIKKEGEYFKDFKNNFSGYVSPKDFFNNGDFFVSNWRNYSKEKDNVNTVKYYVSKATNGVSVGWIKKEYINRNMETLNLHKIYIPAAHGGQNQVLGYPRYGEPNSICSQTYLVIGYDKDKHNFSEEECLNIISYIKTKFFRFMVKIKKNTQNGPRGVYQFVPLQDFTKPWTDEELYKKYNLTEEEIDYIENNIAPMSTSSSQDNQDNSVDQEDNLDNLVD